ncbi:MAG TPA: AbrB/MazE/SpoVT family DNA-binding domain-containing protein [Candidatus Acidoferrales bacterium]|nr:AbrB/MazE/SpoVT family DNA-binding domain-containing protein [Candidatus Acidoferrales bacterium]
MVMVKLDQKMRIRLPKRVSKELGLKGRESLEMTVKDGKIELSMPKKGNLSGSLVLRDMVERPMHSKIKITSELLEKWEDEMWMP